MVETRRITATTTPQSLGDVLDLPALQRHAALYFVAFNESTTVRIFFADAAEQPEPGDAAFPVEPCGTVDIVLQPQNGTPTWFWAERDTAPFIIGDSPE